MKNSLPGPSRFANQHSFYPPSHLQRPTLARDLKLEIINPIFQGLCSSPKSSILTKLMMTKDHLCNSQPRSSTSSPFLSHLLPQVVANTIPHLTQRLSYNISQGRFAIQSVPKLLFAFRTNKFPPSTLEPTLRVWISAKIHSLWKALPLAKNQIKSHKGITTMWCKNLDAPLPLLSSLNFLQPTS